MILNFLEGKGDGKKKIFSVFSDRTNRLLAIISWNKKIRGYSIFYEPESWMDANAVKQLSFFMEDLERKRK